VFYLYKVFYRIVNKTSFETVKETFFVYVVLLVRRHHPSKQRIHLSVI